ncbi:MAG: sigma-70 family RNA polymerase sigma factor [Prevotella sp.]|nr:sigma-70 family RNA polymerase sigma factor [Prevotella sp.]
MDRAEFEDVFRIYYKPLYFFARQLLNDSDDCHDIVQSAFEEVLGKLSSIQRSTVRQYLYSSVRNACIDFIRHQGAHQSYIDFVKAMNDIYYHPEEEFLLREREQRIEEVLSRIPQPTRDIFIACYVDRKRYKEVAKMMSITEVVVKNHIMKALKMVRGLNLKL